MAAQAPARVLQRLGPAHRAPGAVCAGELDPAHGERSRALDHRLGAKLRGSGLEPYVDVIAHIEGEAEKLLLPSYRLET